MVLSAMAELLGGRNKLRKARQFTQIRLPRARKEWFNQSRNRMRLTYVNGIGAHWSHSEFKDEESQQKSRTFGKRFRFIE
jgi:hypothetical protein